MLRRQWLRVNRKWSWLHTHKTAEIMKIKKQKRQFNNKFGIHSSHPLVHTVVCRWWDRELRFASTLTAIAAADLFIVNYQHSQLECNLQLKLIRNLFINVRFIHHLSTEFVGNREADSSWIHLWNANATARVFFIFKFMSWQTATCLFSFGFGHFMRSNRRRHPCAIRNLTHFRCTHR